MKLVCQQNDLATALRSAVRVVTKSMLPTLAMALVETDQNRLKLAATDLSLGITCWIDCQVHEEGGVAVPARLLSDFVSSLPSGPVNMELDARTRTLRLTCGRYQAEIKGLAPMEFPAIPTIGVGEPDVVVDPAPLREAIGQVVFAAATEDTRPAITGVHMRIRGAQMTLVASDRFRLSMCSLELAQPAEREISVIVPARAMAELARILADQQEAVQVVLTPNLNQILFHSDSVDLVANLIEARYPDVEAIIPRTYRTRAVLSTVEFLKAVRIASFFARDGANIIRLEIQATGSEETGRMIVSASAAEVGSNVSEVDAMVEGESSRITFNARYLAEALSALGTAEVAIELQGGSSAGVIKPVGQGNNDQTHVIMPIIPEVSSLARET